MWIKLLGLASALLASSRSEDITVSSRSCSFAGVFHVAGRERYSLKFDVAERLCEHLASSLASLEQVEKAYEKGLQTCRYGWINSSEVVILRHRPHKLCAGNQTGIIRKIPDRKKYDTFCYDAEDTSEKNCTAMFDSLNKTDDDSVSAFTEVTTLQTNAGGEESENSTPVHWTQTSSTQSHTDQTEDQTNRDMHVEEFTTSTGLGVSKTASTSETTANKAEHAIPYNRSIESENSSTPVHWTQTSPTQSHTDQTEDQTNRDMHVEEFTTSTGLGVSKTASTSETTANKAEHAIPYNRSIDWLIILLTVLSVLFILFLCAIVANRKRWCVKKKTLIITKESSSEENRAASSFTKEQEMVKLMDTEKVIGNNKSELIDISPDK